MLPSAVQGPLYPPELGLRTGGSSESQLGDGVGGLAQREERKSFTDGHCTKWVTPARPCSLSFHFFHRRKRGHHLVLMSARGTCCVPGPVSISRGPTAESRTNVVPAFGELALML